jgi:cobalt-zinc-cadmium efflux system membrane fusion protein
MTSPHPTQRAGLLPAVLVLLTLVGLLVALLVAIGGCQRSGADAEAAQTEHDHESESAQTEHAHEQEPAVADEHDHDEHAGHAHGAEEGSDLDRPVAELFAASCEHAMLTHECMECRYEVGVARVPSDLIADGLVSTAIASEQALPEVIELPGEIRFDEHRIAHLTPQVAGLVARVHVDIGSRVTAGDLLLELDSAELASAQADYLGAIAEEALAAKAGERLATLRAAKIASEREALETEQHLEGARIRSASTRQRLVTLGLSTAEIAALAAGGAERADGRLALRAPFAGEILSLHAVRGEQVEPGSELALLGDTAKLWVWVDVYEAQLGRLETLHREGALDVSVRVAAYPEREFPGRLDLLGRTMDEATRTVKSRIVLENPEGLLRPGMFAQVRLFLPGKERALAVPADALLADEGREFVFVHHDGEYFVRRPVRAGRSWAGSVEIIEGLALGQTVATAGAFLLKSDVLRSKMGAGCAD